MAERRAFQILQPSLDPERLVFVDESGIWRGMRTASFPFAKGKGYAPRGQRCYESAPFRQGKRLNLLGWIGLRGGCVAPLVGRVDSGVFAGFVEHYLVPALTPGDIVIRDNARIHAASGVALVEGTGARVLTQPRYSPEMNVIEFAWSKAKEVIKRWRADTQEGLEEALRAGMASITSSDVWGRLRHCGYQSL
ncbi:MAG: transposase [Bacteroidota bacterium]